MCVYVCMADLMLMLLFVCWMYLTFSTLENDQYDCVSHISQCKQQWLRTFIPFDYLASCLSAPKVQLHSAVVLAYQCYIDEMLIHISMGAERLNKHHIDLIILFNSMAFERIKPSICKLCCRLINVTCALLSLSSLYHRLGICIIFHFSRLGVSSVVLIILALALVRLRQSNSKGNEMFHSLREENGTST